MNKPMKAMIEIYGGNKVIEALKKSKEPLKTYCKTKNKNSLCFGCKAINCKGYCLAEDNFITKSSRL